MNNHIQLSLESSSIKMNLNSREDGIYLQPDLEGLTSLPEIRTSSGVNAGMDGGWTSAQFFDARSIAIRITIANEDVALVEQKRRQLNTLLAQGRKEELTLRVVTEAGNAYAIHVRVTAVSASMGSVLKKQDFLIQLRADDPVIYGDTEEGGVVAILNVKKALGGFLINFEMPFAIGGGGDDVVVDNGEEMVYPIIVLKGPLHSPTVINTTTNQQMQIIADVGASDVLTIDSLLRTVTLNGQDIYHLVAEGSSFITIQAGQNKMGLTSAYTSDEGYAEVKFKQGYLSI